MDRPEAISELERVAILLDSTAYALEAEHPSHAGAVAFLHASASELRSAVAELRSVWELEE